MMMMERWKSVPLYDECEHGHYKFKPAVNWFISRRTVFVTPIFDRWYWVWQPRLNYKTSSIFKDTKLTKLSDLPPPIMTTSASDGRLTLLSVLELEKRFAASWTIAWYKILGIQRLIFKRKTLTFFLRDLEIVGMMLLLRTVISLMKDKVKNVFCLRFEKRLRNIGSIPR